MVASAGATSAITMCTPSSAKRFANAWPIPAPAPVMTAILSLWPLPIYFLPDARAFRFRRAAQAPSGQNYRSWIKLRCALGADEARALNVDRALAHRERGFLNRFRQRGMRVAGARDVFRRRTEFHRNGGFCDHVAGVAADDVHAEHAVGLGIGQDFHKPVGLLIGLGAAVGGE